MVKKALQLASVASMIDQFNIPNIQLLQSLGYQVDVVADFTNPGNITEYKASRLKNQLKRMNVHVFDVAIPRSINPKFVLSSYKRVKNIVESENYSLIHCHSPIGGAICRSAAKKTRKTGTNVIYTAHGFHFYSGAPLMNWMFFYPIEKILSYCTDVLITINKEDYKRAKQNFFAKKTVYVPGVGVDLNNFGKVKFDRAEKRNELGIPENAILLFSVGELNENKNHKTIIRAIKGLDVYYMIAGLGSKKNELEQLATENGMYDRVRFLGYRTDVSELYEASDIFLLPSHREGLSVSLMEAMASGLPCVVSRIRGNVDLIDEDKGGYLFDSNDVREARNKIRTALKADRKDMGQYNREKIKGFSVETVMEKMRRIYKGIT